MHVEIEDVLATRKAYCGKLSLLPLNALGKDFGPGDGVAELSAIIVRDQLLVSGFPGVVGLAGIERGLDEPLRCAEPVVFESQFVTIFDDAAHLDVGPGE